MRKFRRAPRGIRPNWRSDRSTLRKGRHDGSFTSLFAWSRCRKSRSRFPTGPSRDHEEQTANGEAARSEEHTSELQSLMRTSYAVFCLKKQTTKTKNKNTSTTMTSNNHYTNQTLNTSKTPPVQQKAQ